MDFTLELLPAARRDLKNLPRSIQAEIASTHLPKIEANPFDAGSPLHGNLKGNLSYHFKTKNTQYRIIYFVDDNLITVTIIGTRDNIYKQAERRYRR